jgi:RecJ-like exonuclease
MTPTQHNRNGVHHMTTFPCFKCGGSGEVAFKHIENGVCFTCGGAGKLNYRPRAKVTIDPHPEWLVSENAMSSIKQWDYFNKLCPDDRQACKLLEAAGAPRATRRYVTRTVMSRAIEMAKQKKAA